jgi:glycosyltransferase involved in cell wall biosynthesis
MEAAALGIPVVADRFYEPSVVEGKTGLLVDRVGQVPDAIRRLVLDDELRLRMSEQAKALAYSNFDLKVRSESWRTMLTEAAKIHE